MIHQLHHLQTSFDDEAAHLRVTRYRVRHAAQHPLADLHQQVRQDCRALPVLLPLLAITVTLIAAVLP